ncbi:hypothetical protein MKX68_15005 [Paenibacillus sp. FSL M8-0212]
MTERDWYILQLLTKWYAKKRQRARMDELITRNEIIVRSIRTQNAIVICM